MERKIIDAPRLRLKADDEGEGGTGTIEGYASTFDTVDSQEERVMKGAFSDTIEEFIQDGFIAVGHDWMSLPVATPTKANEDKVGLFFSGEFHSTAAAQDARTVVRERLDRGKTGKLSIGYDIIEERQGADKVRELTKLRLFEVSIVTVPANWDANIVGAKGYSGLHGRAGATGFEAEDHGREVLAHIKAWIDRLTGIHAMRVKESRTLSAQSLTDIRAARELAKQCDKVLKELEERATVKSADVRTLEREFTRLRLQYEARM